MIAGCRVGYIEDVVTSHNRNLLIYYIWIKTAFLVYNIKLGNNELCKFRPGRKLRLLVLNVGKAVQNNIIGLILMMYRSSTIVRRQNLKNFMKK